MIILKQKRVIVIAASLLILVMTIIGFLALKQYVPRDVATASTYYYYYSRLLAECFLHAGGGCEASVKRMRQGKFLLMPKNGCAKGYKQERLLSIDSHVWCEPDTALDIRSINFNELLTKEYKESCKQNGFTESPPIEPSLTVVSYGDVTGDGKEEAVVSAVSCAMGNGGPDILRVYTASATGSLILLPIEEHTSLNGVDYAEGLAGHQEMKPVDAKLVISFPVYEEKDPGCCPSGGTRNFVYRWDGKAFVIGEVSENGLILSTTTTKTYQNEKYNFSFKYPVDWGEMHAGAAVSLEEGVSIGGADLLERVVVAHIRSPNKGSEVENLRALETDYRSYIAGRAKNAISPPIGLDKIQFTPLYPEKGKGIFFVYNAPCCARPTAYFVKQNDVFSMTYVREEETVSPYAVDAFMQMAKSFNFQ